VKVKLFITYFSDECLHQYFKLRKIFCGTCREDGIEHIKFDEFPVEVLYSLRSLCGKLVGKDKSLGNTTDSGGTANSVVGAASAQKPGPLLK